jgi:hypothetical protein
VEKVVDLIELQRTVVLFLQGWVKATDLWVVVVCERWDFGTPGGGSAGKWIVESVNCILAIMEVSLANSPCNESKAAAELAWCRSR